MYLMRSTPPNPRETSEASGSSEATPVIEDAPLLWSDLSPESSLERGVRTALDQAALGDAQKTTYERLKSEQAALIHLTQSDEIGKLFRDHYAARLATGQRRPEAAELMQGSDMGGLLRLGYAIRLYGGYPPNADEIRSL